jgi:hypothetical protein
MEWGSIRCDRGSILITLPEFAEPEATTSHDRVSLTLGNGIIRSSLRNVEVPERPARAESSPLDAVRDDRLHSGELAKVAGPNPHIVKPPLRKSVR